MDRWSSIFNEVNNIIASNLALVVLVLVLINLLFFIALLNSNRSRKRLWQKYQELMAGFEQEGLEQLLLDCRHKIDILLDKVGELESLGKELKRKYALSVQKVGLVRYNALQTMGGDLSFSLALLDGQANGVVITCIYGREESRTYAKPITNGSSNYALSEEEKQAIKQALERN